MKLLARYGFLCCCLTAYTVNHVYAQSRINSSGTGGINTIQGRIYTPNGRTIDSTIKVRLESTSYTELSLITDQSGGFAFLSLSPGTYSVVIDAGDNFEVIRESVTIDPDIQGVVAIRPIPKIFTIPVYLRPKVVIGDKTGVVNAKYAEAPKDAVKHYEKGLTLNKNEKLDEAIVEFKQAVSIYPALEPAHIELGKIYLKKSRLDDAIASFKTAVRYDPKDFEARLNYAVALYNANQLDEAQTQLNEAAVLNASAVWPHYYLGMIFIQRKDLDSAQTQMEKAKSLKGDKNIPLLHRYLGGIYAAKKMNKQAAEELEKYIQLAPDAKDGDRIRQTIADLRNKN